ncbi:MAG: hypothetical protein R3220_00205 [Balneolaceae bacterium]|nr:hypothetical protein [Balneolaceae bacterium]
MTTADSKRGMKIIGIILLFYAILVGTHEGEFWPFSVYPMFSQAGNPWTRAIVLDVSELPDDEIWKPRTLEDVSANPVPIGSYGVDQIDFSNFISKTDNWTAQRRNALRHMFGPENIGSGRWMASKAHGELVGPDSVVVMIQPFLLVTADSVYMNPMLDESNYFSGE